MSNDSERIELAHCPFCGDANCELMFDSALNRYHAVCSVCLAKGPQYREKMQAIIGWRAPTEPKKQDAAQEDRLQLAMQILLKILEKE